MRGWRRAAAVAVAVTVAGQASAAPAVKPVTVAVLGDSRTDGCVGGEDRPAGRAGAPKAGAAAKAGPRAAGQPLMSIGDCRKLDSGFNEPVLNGLLKLVAGKRPEAVFFTGDLTLGLEREEADGQLDPGALPAVGGWAVDFEYDTATFTRMLTAFRRVVAQRLGGIPFYPAVGNHDTVGPDAVAIFRRTFRLEHPAGDYREPAHLAYTVVIGDAAFVVLATDFYQSCAERGALESACNLQQHLVSQPQLAWLDAQLALHAGKHLFVLGHEPAYSAGPHKSGLDQNEGSRDVFWQILKRRGVTAYLCSHQHRLDISQHDGVWQVISGGAGAPLDGLVSGGSGAPAAQCTGGMPLQQGYADMSFYNYVLIHVPAAGGAVGLEVRDCRDAVRRKLDLLRDVAAHP